MFADSRGYWGICRPVQILGVLAGLLAIMPAAHAFNDIYPVSWVGHYGDGLRDAAQSCCALPDGSYLVHGWFESRFCRDLSDEESPFPWLNRTLFMAKYSADGDLLWVKSAGTPHCDVGGEIAALPDGSFAITARYGWGGRTITFGRGEPNVTYLPPYDRYDICIARFNADGTLRWARRAGGYGWDAGLNISLAPDGAAYVTGQYEKQGYFGQEDLATQVVLTTESGTDGSYSNFLLRYEDNGVLAWVQTGNFASPAALNDGSCAVIKEGVVVLVAPDGAETWRGAGLSADMALTDLCALPGGNEFLVTISGTDTAPLRKYRKEDDGSATLIWESTVIPGTVLIPILAVRPDGSCYVHDKHNGFLFEFDANGALVWRQSLGFTADAICAAPGEKTCFLVGAMYGNLVVGAGQSGQTALEHWGSGDIWMAKIAPTRLYHVATSVVGRGSIVLEPRGNYYPAGAEVTVKAVVTSSSHDEFVCWQDDLEGYEGASVKFNIEKDTEARAIFAELPGALPIPAASCYGKSLLCAAIILAAMARFRQRRPAGTLRG